MISPTLNKRRYFGTIMSVCTTAGICGLPVPVFGQAVTEIDISLGAKVATNPFLVAGDTPTVAAATLQVDPSILLEDGMTTYRLSGSGRIDQYADTYGTDASGRLALTYVRRLSERTTITLSGNASTTLGGVQDIFRVGPITDGQLPPDVINDVSTTGTRLRQYRYGINAGLQSQLSARGTLVVGAGFAVSNLSGPQAQDVTQFNANAGYVHVLSDRLSIGPRFGFAKINYLDLRRGDGNIFSPGLTARLRLSERISADFEAGVSFAKINNQVGIKSSTTALNLQASFCNKGERTNLCLAGSRDVQPTVLGGVSTVTSVSLRYDVQLAEYDQLSFSGRFGQTQQPAFSQIQFGANETKIYGGEVTYSKRLSERTFFTLSPSFNKASGLGLARKANYQATAGVKIRFGKGT